MLLSLARSNVSEAKIWVTWCEWRQSGGGGLSGTGEVEGNVSGRQRHDSGSERWNSLLLCNKLTDERFPFVGLKFD